MAVGVAGAKRVGGGVGGGEGEGRTGAVGGRGPREGVGEGEVGDGGAVGVVEYEALAAMGLRSLVALFLKKRISYQ